MANNRTFFKNVQTGKMTLKDIFSDVKRKHTPQEMARVFIAGTELTTPTEAEMLSGWQKPFLFARFFLAVALFMGVMLPMLLIFGDLRVCYLLMSGISVIMSFTLFLLIWEMNVPRNISLYEAFKIVCIGGALSLVATFALNVLVPTNGAIWAPVTEEPAKLLIVYLVLRKKNYKHILNGVLIGACVGTGFSFIENLYYTWSSFVNVLLQGGGLENGVITGLILSFVRAIYDFSGHGIWAAIYGGALVMVKGAEPVNPKHLTDPRFLKYFAISFGLHMFRNSGISLGISLFGIFTVEWAALVAITVYAFLIMLRRGVNQIVEITASMNQGRVTLAVERDAPIVRDVGGGSVGASYGGNPQGTLPLEPFGGQPESIVPPYPRSAMICCTSGPHRNQSIRLELDQSVVLGRIPGHCDFALSQCNNVSSRHCVITLQRGGVQVTDLGSTNGTFLESGMRLVPNQGEFISFGGTIYLASRECAIQVTAL